MARILASLLALVFLLAGCTDDPAADTDGEGGVGVAPVATPGDDSATSGPAGTGEGTTGGSAGNETNETAAAPNTPPTASLTASNLSAAAPFNVTFMLAGEDADADALSWTLDVDGDGMADSEGQGLPFNFTFSYVNVGNYTVTLNVTDGKDHAVDSLVVEAREAVASGPIQEVEGSWAVGGMAACARGIYASEGDGVLYALFEVDPTTFGLGFSAQFTSTVPTIPDDAPAGGWGIDFLDADLGYLETFRADAAGALSGEVPAGVAHGAFWSCLGGNLSATYAAG